MKITLESTTETARANGLPVRLWQGTTTRGSPVLALISRLAVPDDAHPDDIAEVERELTESPTRVVDRGGSRVESPRFCSTCLGRGEKRPAVQVARDAGGLEWFECGQHAATDNLAQTERLAIEALDAWFDRHELPVPGARDVEAWRAGLITPDEAGLVELVARARERCPRPELLAARHAVSQWLHTDEVFLIGPGHLARSIRTALDAMAIVHGAEAEGEAAELDAIVERLDGDPERPPPRELTDADREALAALHRWLHHPGGDGDLIEAAAAFHAQLESESPGECERLEASIGLEQRAARAEADEDRDLALRVRDVFRRFGVSLDVPASELDGPVHERCEPETHWPPHPLAASIIRTIIADERVSGKGVDELAAARFLAEALRGARMGWHGRQRHADELAKLAEAGAPKHEPARTPWLFGFHVATTIEPGARNPDDASTIALAAGAMLGLSGEVAFATCRMCGCTDLDCSGCIEKTGAPCHWVEPDLCSACAPAAPTHPDTRPRDVTGEPALDAPGPLVLTDAMREYYQLELQYRAPETLNVHERRIIAAVEADERARAADPESWVERGRS